MDRLPLAVALAALSLACCGLAAAAPGTAEASCASAVVVDGHVLLGLGAVRVSELPPRGPARAAVAPACNDGNGPRAEDGTTTVRPLRGVPPTIAVADARTGDAFADPASMVVLGDHPLHRAQYGAADAPSYRERHRCGRERRALRGTLAEDGTGQALRVRRDDRTVSVSVDAATRIAGRPAWQPLRAGQRVVLRTSICGPRRVADTIRLAGPVPPAHRSTGTGDLPGARWPWVVGAVLVALAGFVALAVRAGRRLPAS